jgi:hypothetical protein
MRGIHLLLGGLTAIAAAAATPALADTCKDVRFKVTNDHFEGREIEIRKVKYYNPHTRKTHTEDVKNLTCRHGATCTTAGDNLANALNVDLNRIQVVFRYREHDGDWSSEYQTQPFVPAYRKCTRDKQYGPIVVRDSAG